VTFATLHAHAGGLPRSHLEKYEMKSIVPGLRLLGGTACMLLLVAASPSPGAAQSLAGQPCDTKGAQEERIVEIEGEAFRVTYTCIGHPPKLHWLSGRKKPVEGEDTLRR
jgi:hypothetical protein